mmetsp:Transcript_42854/g.79894  ORF Transcript_42854/g.79894 Transcript_42854/m.79894 type:complete len:255 (+) Transcript_42854:91-855(+)
MSVDLGRLLLEQALRHEQTNVEITVGSEDACCTLAAHRNVLVARSPVLGAMFQHSFMEGQTAKARLEDVDPCCFKAYLHLIYTAKLPDDFRDLDQVLEVLALCDRFQSQGFGEVLASRLRELVRWDDTVGKVMMTYVRLPEDSEYSGSLVGVMGDQLTQLSFKDALRRTQESVLKPIDEDRSRLKAIAARGLVFSMLAFPIMREIENETLKSRIVELLSQITDTFCSLCELPEHGCAEAKRRRLEDAGENPVML